MIETPADLSTPVACEWSMSYTMVKGSVGLTRIHARRLLTACNWTGDVQDAVVIVSELVTNAIRHAHKRGHVLGLRISVLEDHTLVIDVSDPVPAFPRTGGPAPGDQDEGGRGLLVTRALGAEVTWFLRRHVGKTVRATLPAHRATA
ncbi:ATP-binding protein [Streptomyces sp. NBC_00249]|uniref:ATP-binding protein n=1 Tax=Streptomyces sp. NBC_00249 TaxID=2975690 RepID=UPI002251487B|nr:ATP-binding protein [Streptomyces sp. NBC_00249]MCX5196144.1 ATP-binding protein [Streptomyces sp. NBC_00249]